MIREIKGFQIHELLLLVGLTNWSGELELESGNNMGGITFRRGAIILADSPYCRAIGDLLVEDGVITEDELIEMLRLQKKDPNVPIGAMFLRAGKVRFDVIEKMVYEQIRQAIREFAGWPNLSASFNPKELTAFDEIQLPVREFIPPECMKAAMDFLSR